MTVNIQISGGYEAVVDDIDSDLMSFNWLFIKSPSNRIYARRTTWDKVHKIQGTRFMHIDILERTIGRSLIKGEKGDHIDNNPLNNQRNNIRLANRSQNGANTHINKNNTSGYKGVHQRKDNKRWVAYITKDRKRFYLGQFPTAETAYIAYCSAAIVLYGEFARLDK